jgi:hypothetical protein
MLAMTALPQQRRDTMKKPGRCVKLQVLTITLTLKELEHVSDPAQ